MRRRCGQNCDTAAGGYGFRAPRRRRLAGRRVLRASAGTWKSPKPECLYLRSATPIGVGGLAEALLDVASIGEQAELIKYDYCAFQDILSITRLFSASKQLSYFYKGLGDSKPVINVSVYS